VCEALREERAKLQIYDCQVTRAAIHKELGEDADVKVCPDVYTACDGASAVLILTDWDAFLEIDWARVYAGMEKPAFVFDGRAFLDVKALSAIGFDVFRLGTPAHKAV